MTYVQYINCDKWKKVIGITLWIGTTIGLGFGFNGIINYIEHHPNWNDCYMYSNGGDPTCFDQGHIWFTVILFILALLGNFFNCFGIWKVINGHYKWIEIRCGVKPKNGDVKHG